MTALLSVICFILYIYLVPCYHAITAVTATRTVNVLLLLLATTATHYLNNIVILFNIVLKQFDYFM